MSKREIFICLGWMNGRRGVGQIELIFFPDRVIAFMISSKRGFSEQRVLHMLIIRSAALIDFCESFHLSPLQIILYTFFNENTKVYAN